MKIAEDGINLSSPTGKLASLTNTYDPANPITGQSDHFSGQPAINTSYGYSSLNQLTSATSRLNNLTNSYKSAGNLVTNGPEVNQSYNGAVELVSQAWPTRTESYSYDQNGNRTKELGTQNETLSYSGADQLTTLETGSSTYNYTYMGNNIRYSQTYNGTTTYFVYDTQSSVPQLLSDGNNDCVYSPGGTPMEQINQAAGAATYLYTDQLGSVVMEANQSGTVTGTQSYSPYGSLVSTTGTWTTPFGFAGGYTDPTRLIYLVHRYYDPATGQFLSVDPAIGLTGQPYDYADGNLEDLRDLLGLATEGYCVDASGAFSVFSATLLVCLVQTTDQKQVGITATVGLGVGVSTGILRSVLNLIEKDPVGALKQLFSFSGSIAANWQTSNATNLSQLGGKFHYSTTSGFLGIGGQYESFSGPGGINGQQWGVGLGAGGGYSVGTSCTATSIFGAGSSAASFGSSEIDFLNHLNPLSWFYGG